MTRARAIRSQLAVVLTLLALLFIWTPGVRPAVAAPPAVEVVTQEAKADFPRSISFHLAARAPDAGITKASLLFTAGHGPVERVVYPSFEPGPEVDITYDLDTQLEFIPPGLVVTYKWELEDAAGNKTLTQPATVPYDDTRFNWRSLKDGHVSVYWYEGGEDFGRALIESANRTVRKLDQEIGATISQDVKVLVYASDNDFSGALPPNSAEWIGGQAYPALNLVMLTVAPEIGAEQEIGRMMPHELTHVVFNQATNNPYNSLPAWLDEGVATYMQDQPDDRFSAAIEAAARDGRLIPIRALNSSFPVDPNRAILSYAQSASVVDYLVETYGREGLSKLITLFKTGIAYDEALDTAFGLTFDRLDTQWRAWLPYEQPANPDPDAWAKITPGSGIDVPIDRPDSGVFDRIAALAGGLIGLTVCASAFIALIAVVIVRLVRKPSR